MNTIHNASNKLFTTAENKNKVAMKRRHSNRWESLWFEFLLLLLQYVKINFSNSLFNKISSTGTFSWRVDCSWNRSNNFLIGVIIIINKECINYFVSNQRYCYYEWKIIIKKVFSDRFATPHCTRCICTIRAIKYVQYVHRMCKKYAHIYVK